MAEVHGLLLLIRYRHCQCIRTYQRRLICVETSFHFGASCNEVMKACALRSNLIHACTRSLSECDANDVAGITSIDGDDAGGNGAVGQDDEMPNDCKTSFHDLATMTYSGRSLVGHEPMDFLGRLFMSEL